MDYTDVKGWDPAFSESFEGGMSKTMRWRVLALLVSALSQSLTTGALSQEEAKYPWVSDFHGADRLCERIEVPHGYTRPTVPRGSFGDWLRNLPLKPGRPDVLLYDGRPKGNQSAHVAVVDIDVGSKDLQQCADAIIRLRAEYLFSRGEHDSTQFRFTSGDPARWAAWRDGHRPIVKGNMVNWRRSAAPDSSYANFRAYLEIVFLYAGSYSLSRELRKVRHVREMAIGDVFIQGGFPGHAVIVVDMAVNPTTEEKAFLLAQSYMPAQDIHVLRNPHSATSPWYDLDFGEVLETPEWTFRSVDLKRF